MCISVGSADRLRMPAPRRMLIATAASIFALLELAPPSCHSAGRCRRMRARPDAAYARVRGRGALAALAPAPLGRLVGDLQAPLGCIMRPSSCVRPSVGIRAAAGGAPGIVEVVDDVGDPRLAIYRSRRHRDHSAYEAQVRDIASRALGTEESSTAELNKSLVSLRHLGGCVVDVHYTWDCLEQLKAAHEAGRSRACLDSAMVPEGTPAEYLALAAGLFPKVFVISRQAFVMEFGQDVPWESQASEASAGGAQRSPWRRFEGGASQSSCRFALACPISPPLAALRPPYLVLDGLSSANNVGQILRTAFHLGVNSVVASRESWNCLNGRACRVSMGWLYWMDCHLAEESLPATLGELRGLGVRIYAAENQFSEPVSPHLPAGDRRWALVVGSEGSGISEAVVAACDARISVPQQQGKCLNVAHATSICLYELGKFSFQTEE